MEYLSQTDEGADWINQDQDRNLAVVNTVMNTEQHN